MGAPRRKPALRVITFHDPIYSLDCLLVIGVSTSEGVAKFMASNYGEHQHEDDKDEFGGLCTTTEDGNTIIVFLPKFDPKDPDDMSNFAHEMFHMTHMALHSRGLSNTDPEGSEAYAYFMGYVVSKFWPELTKSKR